MRLAVYKDDKGNDAVIIEYGSAKLYIWDEDFEELVHGLNFVSNENKPRDPVFLSVFGRS